MRITWRDGVTTLAAAGAIIVERAYFHAWDWPLIASTRWTIAAIATLTAIMVLFSYVLDKFRSAGWSFTTAVLSLTAVMLTGLGLYYVNSDYVVLLMLNAVIFWGASIIRHATVHEPLTHYHA